MSPWTGWLSFDEFDLLLLGVIAGAHARIALRGATAAQPGSARLPAIAVGSVIVFAASSGVALWRGFADAGGFVFGWFQSYAEPMNSLRVFKPLLWALLIAPLTHEQIGASPERAMRRVGAGMWTGLAIVALAVVWERYTQPGLFNFSRPYRAVAAFWEMHVGGAAIDAYLVMAAPFAAWALWSARRPLRWSVAAVVALLAGYACLMTFSRGVYIAVVLPMLLLGTWLWQPWRYAPASFRWRGTASRGLVAALILEAVAVMWTGSFLIERMSQGDRDLRSRVVHWTHGLTLLVEPAEWLLGIGLGRLPANYARFVPQAEFSGAVQLAGDAADRPAVRLSGPPTRRILAGQYLLVQRVPLPEHSSYRVELDYRVTTSTPVYVGVCEMHLLYERRCQSAVADLRPGNTSWQHQSLSLNGPAPSAGDWFAPRLGFFAITVFDAGKSVDLASIELHSTNHGQLLHNGDFAQQLAHWFPTAQGYFLPWHIDHLYLELLIERGLLGLLAFVAWTTWLLRRLLRAPCRYAGLVPFLTASLCGALLLGLLSSVLDAPRTAFLLFFLMTFAALVCARRWDSDTSPLPSAMTAMTSHVNGCRSTSAANLLTSLATLKSSARAPARAAGRSPAGPG